MFIDYNILNDNRISKGILWQHSKVLSRSVNTVKKNLKFQKAGRQGQSFVAQGVSMIVGFQKGTVGKLRSIAYNAEKNFLHILTIITTIVLMVVSGLHKKRQRHESVNIAMNLLKLKGRRLINAVHGNVVSQGRRLLHGLHGKKFLNSVDTAERISGLVKVKLEIKKMEVLFAVKNVYLYLKDFGRQILLSFIACLFGMKSGDQSCSEMRINVRNVVSMGMDFMSTTFKLNEMEVQKI